MKVKTFAIILAITFFIPLLANAAGELTLTWNWPDDDRVVGVNVYWGYGDYTQNHVDAGNATSYTFSATDLEAGIIDFSATSYDAEANESDYAEAISWDNYLCDNGWSKLMTDYLLETDTTADYDGDTIPNEDDPDIDGDGMENQVEIALYGDAWDDDTDLDGRMNVFDDDSDDDGWLDGEDSAPLFSHDLRYYEHTFAQEGAYTVFVGITLFEVSRVPVCKTLNLTTDQQRNIMYGQQGDIPSAIENLGNLDSANGDEIKITFTDSSSETRDIITGALYSPPSNCDITIQEHRFCDYDGDTLLILLGYCESSSRTIVRIIDYSSITIIRDIEALDTGEQALNLHIYTDLNGDGLQDFVLTVLVQHILD